MTFLRTRAAIVTLLLWAVVWIAALVRGHSDVRADRGARNLEATYHVLLTATALLDDSVSHHDLLPTVTLSGAVNHGIVWGSAIPTDRGDQIYTSFPPAGFLGPAAWFYLRGSPPSREGLLDFNVLIGALASLLWIALALRVIGEDRATIAALGALTAAAVSMASAEVFVSHGLTYWSSSLFQPAFAAFVLALLTFAEQPDDRGARVGVLVTITLCAAIDWSGYVMAVGLAFAAWEYRPFRIYRGVGNTLVLGCAIATALLIGHYALGVDLLAMASMLRSRAQMRSVSHGSPLDLLIGYLNSFGGFLLLGVLCAAVVVRNRRQLTLPHRLLLVACGCAMLENVLLMQHATEFTFDRLKLMGLIVVLAALGWRWAGRRARLLMSGTALVSCVVGWQQYQEDRAGHAIWSAIDHANQRLIADATRYVNLRCAELFSVPHVRGYLPFVMHRNIAELNDPPTTPVGKCGRLTLYGDNIFTDLPRFTEALIERADGEAVRLRARPIPLPE